MSDKEFVLRGRSFPITSPILKLFEPFVRVATRKGHITYTPHQFTWDRDPVLLESLRKLLSGGEVPYSDEDRKILMEEALFYKLKKCVVKIKEHMAERDKLLSKYADKTEVVYQLGQNKLSASKLNVDEELKFEIPAEIFRETRSCPLNKVTFSYT